MVEPKSTDGGSLPAVVSEETAISLAEMAERAVELERWREAYRLAVHLVEHYPRSQAAQHAREGLETLRRNADIEERRELESTFKQFHLQGRFEEALALAEQLVRNFPHSPQAQALRPAIPVLKARSREGEAVRPNRDPTVPAELVPHSLSGPTVPGATAATSPDAQTPEGGDSTAEPLVGELQQATKTAFAKFLASVGPMASAPPPPLGWIPDVSVQSPPLSTGSENHRNPAAAMSIRPTASPADTHDLLQPGDSRGATGLNNRAENSHKHTAGQHESGQGDSTTIRIPIKQQILLDNGGTGSKSSDATTVRLSQPASTQPPLTQAAVRSSSGGNDPSPSDAVRGDADAGLVRSGAESATILVSTSVLPNLGRVRSPTANLDPLSPTAVGLGTDTTPPNPSVPVVPPTLPPTPLGKPTHPNRTGSKSGPLVRVSGTTSRQQVRPHEICQSTARGCSSPSVLSSATQCCSDSGPS